MDEIKRTIDEFKAQFYSIYSNLPLSVRDDVVLVIDGEPITWNVAWLELRANGNKTEKIINDLVELEIIK